MPYAGKYNTAPIIKPKAIQTTKSNRQLRLIQDEIGEREISHPLRRSLRAPELDSGQDPVRVTILPSSSIAQSTVLDRHAVINKATAQGADKDTTRHLSRPTTISLLHTRGSAYADGRCDSRSAWHRLRRQSTLGSGSRSPHWGAALRGAGRGCASPGYQDEHTNDSASASPPPRLPTCKRGSTSQE
jgi:hypothetical protein